MQRSFDIAELRSNENKLYLFVAIDRTGKFAEAQLVDKANRKTAWEFLEAVLEAVPYKIHTILTDNASSFVSSSATVTRLIFDQCGLILSAPQTGSNTA